MGAPRLLSGFLAACLLAGPALSLACSPYIEEPADGRTAVFRPHPTAFEPCEVSEAAYRQVVGDWLRRRPAEAQPLSSLSLGRAVSFPWISRHLADTAFMSPGWAARVARAKPGQRNGLAAPALNDPALLERLAAPFAGSPYALAGVSFEKVLFGDASEYSSYKDGGRIKVPFDAQLWLRLRPREAGTE